MSTAKKCKNIFTFRRTKLYPTAKIYPDGGL